MHVGVGLKELTTKEEKKKTEKKKRMWVGCADFNKLYVLFSLSLAGNSGRLTHPRKATRISRKGQ